jgi:ubiquinone biosynthesis protein UbiJ
MTITEQLRAALEEQVKSHSIEELARRYGVAAPILSRFIRGQRDLKGKTIDRLGLKMALQLRAEGDGLHFADRYEGNRERSLNKIREAINDLKQVEYLLQG